MDRGHLNKLSISFQEKGRHEIWWKLAVSEELFYNIMTLYMYTAQGWKR